MEQHRQLRDQLALGLKRLRRASGLSLQQVADRVGLSKTALNFMENGKSGDFLDSAESFALACKGRLFIIALPEKEVELISMLKTIDTMPSPDRAALMELVGVWAALPPLEQRLMTDAAVARAAATTQASVVALQPRRA